MKIRILFTEGPVVRESPIFDERNGAVVEFYGVVRQEEAGAKIQGLEYQAYQTMAIKVLQTLIEQLGNVYPCNEVSLVHSLGKVPVGEPSLLVSVRSPHRSEALGMVRDLIDGMKRDAPIWKKPY